MENCPKCGEKLNIDEKTSGKCFSCGANFTTQLPEDRDKMRNDLASVYDDTSKENTIARILTVIGALILGFGTLGSVILASEAEYESSFSWSIFCTYEFSCIVSGMLIIGVSEIIKLLEEIKEKMK